MPRFEIFIPKSSRVPMDMRLRIEAESWIEALKGGLKKVGEGGTQAENVLCDIKEDNSIHVTDAQTGRVFQIRELLEEKADDSAPADAPAPTQTKPEPAAEDHTAAKPKVAAIQEEPPPAVLPAQQKPQEQPAPKPEAKPEAKPAPKPAPKPKAKPEAKPEAKPAPKPAPKPKAKPTLKPAPAVSVEVSKQPKPARPIVQHQSGIGRSIDFTSDSTADLLEEVFEITDELNQTKDRKQALYRMLDLAMEKIGTDSGSVLLADINSDSLKFEAARGPKADDVFSFNVRVGQGIVGFCADSGVGLAVSDVSRDPRFYAAISEKLGYPTRSILCVPMQADEQMVGALELINKKGSDQFTETDLGMATFIGHQLARFLLRLS